MALTGVQADGGFSLGRGSGPPPPLLSGLASGVPPAGLLSFLQPPQQQCQSGPSGVV